MDITRPISHPRKTTSFSHKVETRLKLKSNVETRVAGASNKPDDMNSPLLLVPLTNGTLVTFIHIDGVYLGVFNNLQIQRRILRMIFPRLSYKKAREAVGIPTWFIPGNSEHQRQQACSPFTIKIESAHSTTQQCL